MITRRTFLSVAAAMALPLRATAEDLTSGEIIETATGKVLGFHELIDRLEQADTILIGERHGFAPHQDRVALILEELALRGRFPTLALEMLEPAQMPALEAYRADNPEYVGGLGAALNWSETGWPAWSFYEPIFRAAFRAKLGIVAAEAEPESDFVHLTSDSSGIPFNDAAENHWREVLLRQHCGRQDEGQIAARIDQEIRRDRSMIATMKTVGHPKILLVGVQHMETIELGLSQRSTISIAFDGRGPNDGDFQFNFGFKGYDCSKWITTD